MNPRLLHMFTALLLAAALGAPVPATAQSLTDRLKTSGQGFAGFLNPKFNVPITHPPQIVLKPNQKVAVLSFPGECGDELSERLLQYVAASGKFDIIDRGSLDQLLAEQGLQSTGAVSRDSAVRMGRVLGAAAMFTGKVTRCATEVSDPLIVQGQYRDANGNLATKYVRRTTVSMVASVQLVDFATGRMHAGKLIEAQATRVNEAIGGVPEAPSAVQVRTDMYRDAISQVGKMIFPWTETVEIIVYDDNDVKKMQLKPQAETMKRGDFKAAVAQLRNVIAQGGGPKTTAKERNRAQYDLGIALLYSGDTAEAVSNLQSAVAANPGNSTFQSGLAAAQKIQMLDAERVRREQQVVEFGHAEVRPQAEAMKSTSAAVGASPDRKAATAPAKPNATASTPARPSAAPTATAKSASTTVITNDQVLRMLKASLPESAIVTTIKSSTAPLDRSVDALIALKLAGATAAVLDAVQKSGGR